MKHITSLFPKPKSFSSSLSRVTTISTEVSNIVHSIDPMEPSLEQVVPFLTPDVITHVLQHQQDPFLCFRFFVWAAKRKHFRSWASHNLMISMLVGSNKIESFWRVFDDVRKCGYSVPSDAFAVLIGGYAEAKEVERAVEAFGRMKEFDCEPNLFTYNLVLNVLVGKVTDALVLFDEMLDRGIVPSKITYTVVLTGLCNAKRIDDAYRLLENMKSSGNRPDGITYNALLNGVCKLGRMDEAFALLKDFQKDGFELDLNSYSSLIDGLFRTKRFKEGHEMYRKMTETDIEPDVVLHTIMIRGLCDEGRVHDAFKLVREMTDKGVVPDTQAYNTLIKGFCDEGLLDEARSLKLEVSGVDEFPDTSTYTILISGMCRYGLVGEAQNIFNEMEKAGCVPSVVTFNALIDGLCKSGELQKAHLMFYKMEIGRNPSLFLRLTQGSDRVVDSGSLQTMVTKLCESGSTLKAYKLLTQLADTAIMPTITTYNILINGLCKAGILDGAFNLFKELRLKGISPDSVTYGTLINGLQIAGREDDAFLLLEEMVSNGCKPTPAVYRTLMKWSCRRKKTFAAFNLWLRYLKSLPKRDEKIITLVEECLRKDEVERAVRLLLDMDIKLQDLDSAPYTIWLIGFCQGRKTTDALMLLSILKEYNIRLTPASCVMLISTLYREGKLSFAVEVFLYALQKGFILKPRICNNLLKSLLRSRYIDDAFDLMEKMDSCGYNLDDYLDVGTRFLIKRRMLGENHADYAETMYHLGKVLYLQGNGKDAESLIKDSIRILEDGAQGESSLCMRRLRYLVQITAFDHLHHITATSIPSSQQHGLLHSKNPSRLRSCCFSNPKSTFLFLIFINCYHIAASTPPTHPFHRLLHSVPVTINWDFLPPHLSFYAHLLVISLVVTEALMQQCVRKLPLILGVLEASKHKGVTLVLDLQATKSMGSPAEPGKAPLRKFGLILTRNDGTKKVLNAGHPLLVKLCLDWWLCVQSNQGKLDRGLLVF
ncbi:pentatricopeptide repeat (PPR) superfamily protein [Artemisia annua]|uniref:Pentatricopeptide repeat (PPR) superfamily protein n=1 Tax=Artemisia annua TaxID=35608 RepID=A0A2U1LWE2_ARTAN|nr:pentatricopeptide repeat (PPR) superfamily protein [Artemisia annua]